ncbi:membrane protein, putative [Babesia bigemina]|uniref:Membrane protein, putative n=1 Tax=Babesia bigemina TaxID=5866 RepID=A0A061D500_BABBI|nr:membrane protein, putative [Babesia bigemina]CDR94039.1 membrane protein, putative [Babesia bigemina]|eukprot:XP_012766225.1 membrane protein, putative [Babesia bigemina]
MKVNTPRTAMMIAVSVALVATHTVVKRAAAEMWSVKDMFNNAVEKVTSYAINARTIQYVDDKDFGPKGEMMQTVELAPGQSIKYSCGKHGTAAKGTFALVPSDPRKHILAPKGDDPFEVALNRIQPSYNVYRSDRSLIVETFQRIGLDHLLIDYADNAVIMAKDNERFSMNLLCVFVPADVNLAPKYGWLQIKFKEVLPMAYGCGSAGFHLFKNAIPLPPNPSDESIMEASRRRIEAEPGMVIGIYCAPNDHIYPSDCFRKVKARDKKGETTNYFSDPDFKYRNLKGNIRLMKVKAGAMGFPAFTCYCKNAENQTTAALTVAMSRKETCDFTKLLEFYGMQHIIPRFLCYKRLGRGKSVRLVVDKSDGMIDQNRLVGGLTLHPEDVTNITYLSMKSQERMKKVRIDHLIGSAGLRITQRENKDNYIYDFDVTDDAIIVLKQPVANLTYVYDFYDRFQDTPKTFTTLVSLQIVPTDPYTHGCGVGYSGLFNNEGVVFENTHVKTGKTGYHTQVNCTVNGWSTSPVGFYCPKDHILEPSDCFTSIFLGSTDRTAKMADYAPLARVINAPNLRVIDFSAPNTSESKSTYSDAALQCRCKTKDGTIVATITVTLNKPQQH